MITNPVYNREMKVSARSIRFPLILACFNIILAAFALTSMTSGLSLAHESAGINYASFLTIFRYVATIEFALILFVMPALTAGSISGERERRTLDLMLTTKLTPARIVAGKLLTSISNVVVVLVSSLPILALVFVYGGVTVWDFIVLMIAFLTVAVFTASIGIFASSFCSRSPLATALAYAFELIIVGGTAGINILALNMTGTAGRWIYLLLVNPVATFYSAINAMTGNRNAIADIASGLGTTVSVTHSMWFAVGTALQFIVSTLLVFLSIRNLYPRKK